MKLARSSDKRLRSSSIDMPDNLGRRSGESSRTPSTGKAPDRPRDQGLPRPFRGQKGGLIPKQDALNQSRPVGRVPAMLLRIRTELGIAHPGLAATAVTSPLCKSLTSTMRAGRPLRDASRGDSGSSLAVARSRRGPARGGRQHRTDQGGMSGEGRQVWTLSHHRASGHGGDRVAPPPG